MKSFNARRTPVALAALALALAPMSGARGSETIQSALEGPCGVAASPPTPQGQSIVGSGMVRCGTTSSIVLTVCLQDGVTGINHDCVSHSARATVAGASVAIPRCGAGRPTPTYRTYVESNWGIAISPVVALPCLQK